MQHKNVRDIVFLVVWTLLVTVWALISEWQGGPWLTTLLYFVAPSAYITFTRRLNLWKISLGALLIGVAISLPYDILANLNGSWFVPADKLLIPWQFLGFYPVEEILWFYFLAYYTIVFYESFVDDERRKKLSRNLKPAFTVWIAAGAVVLGLVVLARSHLLVPYSYMILTAPFVLAPIIYQLWKKPLLMGKFLGPTIFFFFVALNFEIVALSLGDWGFNGDYVGLVSFFGRSFPFEEFFFWITLYPVSALSYYELLVDDER